MGITWEDLREYVGASDDRQADLERAVGVAVALLADALGSAHRQPALEVENYMTLRVATEVFKQQDAGSGDGQYAVMDGRAQTRGPRDPLTPVRPVLRRYVMPL